MVDIAWAKFYEGDRPVMGSDGSAPLDGRWGRDKAMEAVTKFARSLDGVGKRITSADVYKRGRRVFVMRIER